MEGECVHSCVYANACEVSVASVRVCLWSDGVETCVRVYVLVKYWGVDIGCLVVINFVSAGSSLVRVVSVVCAD